MESNQQALRSLQLRGTITVKSPVAITQPFSGEGRKTKDPPPQPVPTTAVFFGDASGGAIAETAYIPASSIRGTLRRCGQDNLLRRREAAGLPPPDLRSFYMGRIGGVRDKGKASANREVGRELALRARNPFLSLWGAADAGDVFFLSGRISVDHALPVTPLAPDACPAFPQMRSDDVLRDPAGSAAKLDDAALDAWRLRFEAGANTSALRKELKGLERAAKAAKAAGKATELADARRRLAAINEALSTAQTSIAQPLPGYRALPPGLVLPHAVSMGGVTMAEIGTFFDALRAFAADPVIGGHVNHGCGRVQLDYQVREVVVDATGGCERIELGHVRVDPEDGLTINGDRLKALVDEALQVWGKAATEGDFRYAAAPGAHAADEDGDE